MGDHKKNVISMMAARGMIDGKQRAATGGAPQTMPPGARAMQLNYAAWLQLVLEQSKDLVCTNCGFGFLVPVYRWLHVPAMLHPDGVEGPLEILCFWMCPNCAKFQLPKDMKVLQKRLAGAESDGQQAAPPYGCGATADGASPGQEGDETVAQPSTEASTKREFLGTQCPTCGCEQYRIGDVVSCALGHEKLFTVEDAETAESDQ